MNLEIYRVHKKLPVEPSIKCKVNILNNSNKKGAPKYITVEAELIYTSGLANDDTIIFLSEITIDGKKEYKHVNEKNIIYE